MSLSRRRSVKWELRKLPLLHFPLSFSLEQCWPLLSCAPLAKKGKISQLARSLDTQHTLFLLNRKIRQRQINWEQQNLYNIKNPLMAGPKSIYGSRGIPVGNISNYSCDGFKYACYDALAALCFLEFNHCHLSVRCSNGDYMESIASYKRNGSILDGRSAHTEISSKSRQVPPPDGASSLNPPRSPPFSDRFSKSNAHMNDWYDSFSL